LLPLSLMARLERGPVVQKDDGIRVTVTDGHLHLLFAVHLLKADADRGSITVGDPGDCVDMLFLREFRVNLHDLDKGAFYMRNYMWKPKSPNAGFVNLALLCIRRESLFAPPSIERRSYI
jgi:hypothetical protein